MEQLLKMVEGVEVGAGLTQMRKRQLLKAEAVVVEQSPVKQRVAPGSQKQSGHQFQAGGNLLNEGHQQKGVVQSQQKEGEEEEAPHQLKPLAEAEPGLEAPGKPGRCCRTTG